ncbi:NAD-dependent epimerase/dehydratase family protein [Fimbriimonas ginsengisoli]|uniref:NAD-dependent epimerase/dehydratase n=1 Tax=Fimbriimonas ginsengisoli Gsoil 348 TaxID=661478 RepID=A0A068NSZ1_FIMGI|nr:NAD(P)-dependent oxidoreductase [Fimbriimonas ginsengisoli]AIE86643.1 NAD-dependent epimerase/dehydratase [Fimbriimonas ginsengisoli Gsoil 348]
MSRVLITGSTGFIGTNLVELYRSRGDEVRGLDLAPARDPAHSDVSIKVDICDAEAVRKAVAEFRPNVIHHLAARTDIDGQTLADYPANTTGVRNVLEAARQLDSLDRIIVASSQLVNPTNYVPTDEFDVHPPNAYGESKVETEKITREFTEQLPWVLIRPTTIWGPWFGVKYQGLYQQVKAGRYMHPRGQQIRKVWGFVGNATYCLSRLADAPADKAVHKVFYVADYEPYDLLEYAETIRRVQGARPIRQVPPIALVAIARFGDVVRATGRSFPLYTYRLKNFFAQMRADVTPLRDVCGPAPYDIEKSVELTVDWMRRYPDFDRN